MVAKLLQMMKQNKCHVAAAIHVLRLGTDPGLTPSIILEDNVASDEITMGFYVWICWPYLQPCEIIRAKNKLHLIYILCICYWLYIFGKGQSVHIEVPTANSLQFAPLQAPDSVASQAPQL